MRTEGRLPPPSDEQVDLAVEVLRMLADGTRLRLLWLLSEDELSVNDLAQTFSVYPSLTGSITEAARQLMRHDDLD